MAYIFVVSTYQNAEFCIISFIVGLANKSIYGCPNKS